MILSSLLLKWISDQKGYGLFATKRIPKGCITFAQDNLDLVITPEQFSAYPPHIKTIVDKYSYQTPTNNLIISWDLGKYMNHCCYSNTLTTGYGFEIAIRDIEAGEEVTDDYRLFTTDHPMDLQCDKNKCGSQPNLLEYWDEQVSSALLELPNVEQELIEYLDESVLEKLNLYLTGKQEYISVETQLPKEIL